jgi:hypothetical protein
MCDEDIDILGEGITFGNSEWEMIVHWERV